MRAVLSPADPEQRLGVVAKGLLAAEILRTYARVRWLLRRRDLPATVAALEAEAAPAADAPPSACMRSGRRLARSTCRCLGALPADSRCLVRSLVLLALLARRGVDSAVVIGVHPGDEFGAHAWVERDETPLLPTGDGTYARLLELGRQSRPASA